MTSADRQSRTVALLTEARTLEAQLGSAPAPQRTSKRPSGLDRWLARPPSEVARRVEDLRWTAALLHESVAMRTARRWLRTGQDLGDLLQEGRIGLYDAALRFDPDRRIQFSTFARWWVRARISRAYGPGTHLSSGWREVARNIARAEADGIVSDEHIAEALGVTVDDVRWVRLHMSSPTSLETPAAEDGDPIIDVLPGPAPERSFSRDVEIVLEHLGSLHLREQTAIRLYFGLDGEPQTLHQIGRALGVSRERVRQIRDRVVAELQERVG